VKVLGQFGHLEETAAHVDGAQEGDEGGHRAAEWLAMKQLILFA
jgi:hypothetical protein